MKINDKYLDLARGLKKLWYLRVTVIPIVVGALGTVPKTWERKLYELESNERIERIQNGALLRPEARRLEETCCLLYISEKPLLKNGLKNSLGVKMIIQCQKITK